METLTQEEAIALLQHPMIKFSGVARECGLSRQQLYERVYESAGNPRQLSPGTLAMLTIAFSKLWVILNKNPFL